ncbi:hypothetical protein [Siansivirga zeaxanthinifaciens]|nr:hypothetical protein [Siansivirga zeaxanthinifaciens]
MKTKMRTLLLIPFFALLLFTSCQDEVIEITEPTEAEALTASSELTAMISSTAKMDGSKDNVIDNASCLSVQLPVTVIANGIEVKITTVEGYKTVAAIFKEFDDDDDKLQIMYPITIILSDYTEVVVNNREEFINLAKDCKGENEEDDDIECIDFQYPISFSVYNREFQLINTVTIESDRQLFKFMHRVKNNEVIAKLNYPVTMELADGTEIIVKNNIDLRNAIAEAKNACDEDDDNDFGDDDFTKERLDNLLKQCPWVVYEFERNDDNLIEIYREYAIVFKEDNVVRVRARGGNILTGTWSTRVINDGALIKLEFETLVDFSLEWFVYDLDPGRIKLFKAGGNRAILKKNCDVVIDFTKERIENYLQECLWRVARLSVNGIDNEKEYIGTPLKFFPNNVVKIRVNGEFVEGTYQIGVRNTGFVLQINLAGRPNLQLEWFITLLEPGLIKLENANSRMVLERHCPDVDGDLIFIDGALVTGLWEVALYKDGNEDKTSNYAMYSIDFRITGNVKVFNPNNVLVNNGSWLTYRNNGLFLGLLFENQPPFGALTHRWVIKEVSAGRIELKDLSASGSIEKILVLEKKS